MVRVAETCKRFRHGDTGLKTELPIKSAVVTALRERAFSHPEQVARTRPTGFSKSWIEYLARCARLRCCREAPPVAGALHSLHSLFVAAAGRLRACSEEHGVAQGE